MTSSSYAKVTFSTEAPSKFNAASPSNSSTIGSSSSKDNTLSPLANVWFRLFDRLDSAVTGPKDPIIAIVASNIASNVTFPA